MTGPWFDMSGHAWIPGTAYGVLTGVLGGLAGWLVPRGRARSLIVPAWIAVWIIAVLLLVAGIMAKVSQQPWGVWYGLLLPGIIGTTVVGANTPVILKRYQEAEERQLAAKDLF